MTSFTLTALTALALLGLLPVALSTDPTFVGASTAGDYDDDPYKSKGGSFHTYHHRGYYKGYHHNGSPDEGFFRKFFGFNSGYGDPYFETRERERPHVDIFPADVIDSNDFYETTTVDIPILTTVMEDLEDTENVTEPAKVAGLMTTIASNITEEESQNGVEGLGTTQISINITDGVDGLITTQANNETGGDLGLLNTLSPVSNNITGVDGLVPTADNPSNETVGEVQGLLTSINNTDGSEAGSEEAQGLLLEANSTTISPQQLTTAESNNSSSVVDGGLQNNLESLVVISNRTTPPPTPMVTMTPTPEQEVVVEDPADYSGYLFTTTDITIPFETTTGNTPEPEAVEERVDAGELSPEMVKKLLKILLRLQVKQTYGDEDLAPTEAGC